jgi:uncharacterized membrane protein
LDPDQHLQKDDPAQNLIPWLDEVHASQNAVSSAIDLPSQSEIREQSRYCNMAQYVVGSLIVYTKLGCLKILLALSLYMYIATTFCIILNVLLSACFVEFQCIAVHFLTQLTAICRVSSKGGSACRGSFMN